MNYCVSILLLIWTSITVSMGQSVPTTVNSHTAAEMDQFLQKCEDFSFDLLPGYLASNNISDQNVLNVAHGKFEAYIQFLQEWVMQRNDMYFSIKEFPVAYQLVFPPSFPIVCYQAIMKSMNKQAHSSLHNVLPNVIKRQFWTGYEDMWYVQMYKRARDHVYLGYNELANYLHGSQRNPSALLGEICRVMQDVSPGAISDKAKKLLDEENEEARMSQFNRLFLNNLAKLFIGDVVIQQIVVHGCMGLGYKPVFNQRQSWSRTMAELERRENRILHEWPTILNDEVEALPKSGPYESWNNWLTEIKQRLSNKYYWLFFRIHKYDENAKVLCYNAPSMKCVKVDNTDVQIRWGQSGGQIENDVVDLRYTVPWSWYTSRPSPVIQNRLIQAHHYNPEFGPQPAPVTVDISSKMDALQADIESSVTRILDIMQNPELLEFNSSQPEPVLDVFPAVRNAYKASVDVLDEVEKRLHPLGQAACSYLPKANTESVYRFIKEKFSILHEKFEATSSKIENVLTYFDSTAKLPDGTQPPSTQSWPAYVSYKSTQAAWLRSFRFFFKHYAVVPRFSATFTEFVQNIKVDCIVGIRYTRITPHMIIRSMYDQLIGEATNPARLGHSINSFYGVHYHRMHTLSALLLNDLAAMLVFNTQCAFFKCWSWFDKSVKNVSDYATVFVQGVRKEIFRLNNEYMYKWQDELRQVLSRESPSTTDDAEPLAQRFDDLYPWNLFQVFVFKSYSVDARLPRLNRNDGASPYYDEKIFQFKWLANPDFSAVHRRAAAQSATDTPDTYTIVNWQMHGGAPIVATINNFGYDCNLMYTFDAFLQLFFINPISSTKSIFAIRAVRGLNDECQPLNADLVSDEVTHTMEVDNYIRPHQNTHPKPPSTLPWCAARAGHLRPVFRERHCYIYACPTNRCRLITSEYRLHRQIDNALLQHVGTGY